MRLTRIHQVAARLDDPGQTRSFYEELLGARYLAHFDPPGLLFFDFGGTRLLFESGNAPATIYFWVDDIEQAHEELTAKGLTFQSSPHLIHRDDDGTFGEAGDEEWMAFLQDPSGNTVALATRRASKH